MLPFEKAQPEEWRRCPRRTRSLKVAPRARLSRKINKSALRIHTHQFHLNPVACIHASLAAHQTALDGRILHADKYSLRRDAGHHGGKTLADTVRHGDCRDALIHATLDFYRRIFP